MESTPKPDDDLKAAMMQAPNRPAPNDSSDDDNDAPLTLDAGDDPNSQLLAETIALAASSAHFTQEPDPSELPPDRQVRFKTHPDHLDIILPPETATLDPDSTIDLIWSDLWQQIQQRLAGAERFLDSQTIVHLQAQNRLIDVRQLQEIEENLATYNLKLIRVHTSRRQTAVAAAAAGYGVEQQSGIQQFLSTPTDDPASALTEPLYLQTTVRSGAEIRHPGTVIILGDINPGSSVIADGDVLVWGRLRGIAHAGASGNKRCLILALQLEATQLRIADRMARVPQGQGQPEAEVAYIVNDGIRIARAAGFTRYDRGS
jgi:septum site-determining protein MinC